MCDGVKGRAGGVIVLRDGQLLGGDSEVFGTSLGGTRSVNFRATLRRLAD